MYTTEQKISQCDSVLVIIKNIPHPLLMYDYEKDIVKEALEEKREREYAKLVAAAQQAEEG